MRINFSDVQRNVSEIANRGVYTIDVLYELMAAYGRSAASVTKLRSGNLNLAEDKETVVLQRGVVYFNVVTNADSLPAEVEKLEQDPLTQRYNPRFLIATDLKTFAAKDTKKGNTLEIAWENIDRNVDFFYGWTGDEVTDEKTEATADRRAADKMKELYQELEKVNLDKFKNESSDFRHHLNVFFTRLLFCFFAEDTQVFSKDDTCIFTASIKDFTQSDGSDLDEFLGTLFESLDEADKSTYTSPFSKFPYVNGKIFDKKHGIGIPKFNAQARKLILDCGALSWAEINPDIFGSMFQSIVDEEHRSTHGMHYTSVPNIMKTIEPLFLDELRDEFDEYFDNPKQLQKLHDRISKIKVFDPACGSGNFLIIAYKELRKLEHAIIDRLYDEEYKRNALAGKLSSRIELDNFYGIEIDDFACEVAVLSLYLAKHQMNIEFEKLFGREIKLIPLKDKANIVHGNAARIDWQEVCPNKPTRISFIEDSQQQLIEAKLDNQQTLEEEVWEEIYLIGNPPYSGSRKQNKNQKSDLEFVFAKVTSNYRNMDYVGIWFYKSTMWLGENLKSAFSLVSVNSVTQGQQIELIWPILLSEGIKIDYAYTSFKWENNAKNRAGVTCVIISMSKRLDFKKFIQTNSIRNYADEITPYLKEKTHNLLIGNRNIPISSLPRLDFGNMPLDHGHLLLSNQEKANLLKEFPQTEKYIRRIFGAKEYLHSVDRWCLWVEDADYDQVKQIPLLAERIALTRQFRLNSKDKGTRKKADKPYQFREMRTGKTSNLILPAVTAEQRKYLICGILPANTVISNRAYMIADPEHWVLSLLTSRMHAIWTSYVSGKLELRINYSSGIVYNNFPISELTDANKLELGKSAKNILFIRENHTEKTLAEMYDPDKMPSDLREAHHQNDLLVDRLYRQKPYTDDEERLADLFKLYEEMVAKEKK